VSFSVQLRVRSRLLFPQNLPASTALLCMLCRTYGMARKRRADSSSNLPSSPMTVPRRRSTLRDIQASNPDGDIIVPKIINARPSLEKAEMYGIDDPRPASSRIMALVGRIFIETIPQWLAVGAMLGLIFGGCCSNVSAIRLDLEAWFRGSRGLYTSAGIRSGGYC
jgi:hypothetical protein